MLAADHSVKPPAPDRLLALAEFALEQAAEEEQLEEEEQAAEDEQGDCVIVDEEEEIWCLQ